MAFRFSAASEQDLPEVALLLQQAFCSTANAQAVNPSLMRWKFLDPRPDWKGSRSYTLRQDDRLVAHACAYPVTFLVPSGELRANHMGDWAAGKNDPGSGLLVWRRLSELTPVMLTVGGSHMTRQLLPRMHYRTQHTWNVYARVVRPWRQFRTDPSFRGWKQPLRLLRNTAWSLGRTAGHSRLSARKVSSFDDSIQILFASEAPFVRTKRSPELLNYFLQCPDASFEGYVVIDDQQLRGWFLLSRVGHQTRIADIWVQSIDPSAWSSVYSLAVEIAGRNPDCCEISAAGSTEIERRAIEANGFRLRSSEPVFVYDPHKLLEGATLQIEMIDGDGAFLRDPGYPYLT